MRTTLDLPDDLYRRTKAVAALRGSSMKDLVIRALRREMAQPAAKKNSRNRGITLPIHLKHTKKLDLTGFDLDDLLT